MENPEVSLESLELDREALLADAASVAFSEACLALEGSQRRKSF